MNDIETGSMWAGPVLLLEALHQSLPASSIYIVIRRLDHAWVQKVGETAARDGLRGCMESRYKPPLQELLTESERATFYLAWWEAPVEQAERRNIERLLTERFVPLGRRGYSKRVSEADRERLHGLIDALAYDLAAKLRAMDPVNGSSDIHTPRL